MMLSALQRKPALLGRRRAQHINPFVQRIQNVSKRIHFDTNVIEVESTETANKSPLQHEFNKNI